MPLLLLTGRHRCCVTAHCNNQLRNDAALDMCWLLHRVPGVIAVMFLLTIDMVSAFTTAKDCSANISPVDIHNKSILSIAYTGQKVFESSWHVTHLE